LGYAQKKRVRKEEESRQKEGGCISWGGVDLLLRAPKKSSREKGERKKICSFGEKGSEVTKIPNVKLADSGGTRLFRGDGLRERLVGL